MASEIGQLVESLQRSKNPNKKGFFDSSGALLFYGIDRCEIEKQAFRRSSTTQGTLQEKARLLIQSAEYCWNGKRTRNSRRHHYRASLAALMHRNCDHGCVLTQMAMNVRVPRPARVEREA